MNKQKLTLFVLLIIFAISLGWSFYAAPRQKTVENLKYSNGQTAIEKRKPAVPAKSSNSPTKAATNDERVLRVDLLEKSDSSFKGYKRNIFKPVFVDELLQMKQKTVAMKPPASTQKLAQQTVKPAQQPPIAVVAKPEPPRSALARFTFLGFLQKDGKKTIFLTRDKDIILVKNGERFSGGRYEVRSLTDQALTIVVVENGEEIVVPLLENRPLIAAAK